MLNPLHLRTLQEVVRHGSMVVAARRLGYTASAVSQHISALERATGVTLFERTGRSVRATAAAVLLAERSHGVLAGMESLMRDVAGVAEQRTRVLKVGCFPSASRHVMPAVLAGLREQLNGLEVYLSDGEPSHLIQELVEKAALDVAVVYRFDQAAYLWPRDFKVRELAEDPLDLAVAAAHPLAGRDAVSLAELAEERWITHTMGVSGALSFERACVAAGFSPRISARSDDYAVILALVHAGHGIAAVPRTALREAAGVTRLRLDERLGRTVLALTRTEEDPTVEHFLAALTAELDRLTG
jgi:DNA-binding transcriptional LysR family regulator